MPAPARPTRGPAGEDLPAGADIGSRLRALRKRYGLSQRELAKRSGLTNGTISLIERNRISPTVASLKKVIEGFPISLAEFFDDETDVRPKVFYRHDELTEISSGPLTFRQIGRSLRGRRLQMLHERYEPGADTGAPMLRHKGEEAGVVVRGAIEVTVGGERRVLEAGDAYAFDSRVPHRFRNVGTEPCEIVSAGTPPSF
ncbi:MAG: cupin domain-containing protein [Planctomycetota bacterium]|jgi:transcriptional regulator with XRE-family HTH domain